MTSDTKVKLFVKLKFLNKIKRLYTRENYPNVCYLSQDNHILVHL